MVLSSVNGASAVDLKVSGAWLVGGNVTDGLFGGDGKNPATEPLRKDASDGVLPPASVSASTWT